MILLLLDLITCTTGESKGQFKKKKEKEMLKELGLKCFVTEYE